MIFLFFYLKYYLDLRIYKAEAKKYSGRRIYQYNEDDFLFFDFFHALKQHRDTASLFVYL